MKSSVIILSLLALSAGLNVSCGKGDREFARNISKNKTPHIPAQCYTKTETQNGGSVNSCYTCHTTARPPNYFSDVELQSSYALPADARKNPWKNLFRDLRKETAAISDAQIQAYVSKSNYFGQDGTLTLAKRLKQALPRKWDKNQDGRWGGYVPDCYFNFDQQGFDRNPKGKATGWRVFAYYPFPGGFWPTNGSTDDVLVRLPLVFRQGEQGRLNQTVYKTNLAILEALIKGQDVATEPLNEIKLGVDLDKNGRLGIAQKIKYDWAPNQGRHMSYVGRARLLQKNKKIRLAAGLYPRGTEFLHSVRYINVGAGGSKTIGIAPRMKELRYARKGGYFTYGRLKDYFLDEFKEKGENPDMLRRVVGNLEQGVSNGMGWRFQGFIEDKQGELRPQTYEEHASCVACHSTIGGITDATFAFPRKLDAKKSFRRGWYHWLEKGLAGISEPKRQDGKGEYTYYLEQNRAGDEFRANTEVIAKFFDEQGRKKQNAFTRLESDISYLLNPTPARALELNKAYLVLVKEQSFIYGKSVPGNSQNIHREVKEGEETGVKIVARNRLK